MEVNIKCINIYNDGVIEMFVICNSCNKQNIHTITHASSKINDKITIDFSKLGKRCCDGHYIQNKQRIRCDADYNLYNPQCVSVSTTQNTNIDITTKLKIDPYVNIHEQQAIIKKMSNSSKVKTKPKKVKKSYISVKENTDEPVTKVKKIIKKIKETDTDTEEEIKE